MVLQLGQKKTPAEQPFESFRIQSGPALPNDLARPRGQQIGKPALQLPESAGKSAVLAGPEWFHGRSVVASPGNQPAALNSPPEISSNFGVAVR